MQYSQICTHNETIFKDLVERGLTGTQLKKSFLKTSCKTCTNYSKGYKDFVGRISKVSARQLISEFTTISASTSRTIITTVPTQSAATTMADFLLILNEIQKVIDDDEIVDGTITTWDNLDEMYKLFAYRGFDPKAIAKAWRAQHKKALEETAAEDSVVVGNLNLRPVSATHQEEAAFFLSLYLARGTNIDKMTKKMNEKMAAYIIAKKNRMLIKARAGSNPAPDLITLGRLANTYPHITLVTAFKQKNLHRALAPFGNMKFLQISQLGCFSRFDVKIYQVALAVNCHNDMTFLGVKSQHYFFLFLNIKTIFFLLNRYFYY